jgi:hypothetical protein
MIKLASFQGCKDGSTLKIIKYIIHRIGDKNPIVYRMGENICQLSMEQGIAIQNVQSSKIKHHKSHPTKLANKLESSQKKHKCPVNT